MVVEIRRSFGVGEKQVREERFKRSTQGEFGVGASGLVGNMCAQ
jgi:hypothetical protein